MKLYAIQPDILWEQKEKNLEHISLLLERLNPEPDSLIVLPEMFATGFSMNVRVTREAGFSLTDQYLSEWTRKYRSYIIAGVVRPAPGVFARNEAVFYGPRGSCLGRYAKLHPFSLRDEAKYYQPGIQVVVWRLGEWRLAPFICYDLRFPEVFRLALRNGAELMVVIASWPSVRQEHWKTLLRARAIENQAYVVGVNRTGSDPSTHYAGGSIVIDPTGEVVAELGSEEGVLNAEIDRDRLVQWRQEFPAWREMRFISETYPQLA